MTEFLPEHPYRLDVNADLPFCSGTVQFDFCPSVLHTAWCAGLETGW